ncbi:MAG: type I phosphomannose isomerase catalytic subunit [Planctomycetota bacterium]
MSILLYPLKFGPVYKEKVWGGRTLQQRLGRGLPGDEQTLIGESWELVDLATTSASGGGGGAERSVVTHGRFAGQTLAQLIEAHGRAVMGDLPLSDDGGFPVLLKYLDANQHLSVQVHPSPDYAAAHTDAFLKSEAWYIVAAEPGSVIYKGIKEGVTPEELRAAIQTNTDEAVVPLMIEVPVKPGDCHYVPSGTCHALGAGILVAEVQTPSDTTYRVYDWGRTGRELHVDQAIDCIHFGPPDVSEYELFTTLPSKNGGSGGGATVERLVACEFFRIDKVTADAGYDDGAGEDQPTVWMVLDGEGELTCDGHEPTTFGPGDTILLPPGMTDGQVAVTSNAQWLEVSFPQAENSKLA